MPNINDPDLFNAAPSDGVQMHAIGASRKSHSAGYGSGAYDLSADPSPLTPIDPSQYDDDQSPGVR